jgi:8-oxo-dGTP pyrophosphatase MutT (NUDIX family)
MLYKNIPKKFNPKFEIVSCFCEWRNKILLLQRQEYKPQGGTWGVPAGKMDKSDISIELAMIRELWEETGVQRKEENLKYFDKFYVRYPDFDFVYHIFQTGFTNKPEIIIRKEEHQGFKWVNLDEAKKMNLIGDLDKCIDIFY